MNIKYEVAIQDLERMQGNEAILISARFSRELIRSTPIGLLSFMEK